jgi:hypothetical protein
MMISEAIAMPLAGFMTYFVLRKNIKLSAGLPSSLVSFFCLMIANGNAQVRRMRTAFDPNDASYR